VLGSATILNVEDSIEEQCKLIDGRNVDTCHKKELHAVHCRSKLRLGLVALVVVVITAAITIIGIKVVDRMNTRIQRLEDNSCDSFRALLALAHEPHQISKNVNYAQCKHVFIDGGSNRGDTIDTVAGVAENGEITEMRNDYLKAISTGIDEVCYFGFEGNSKFDALLKRKQEKYASKFKLIEMRTRTVLLNETKNLTFYIDPAEAATGSTLVSEDTHTITDFHRAGAQKQDVKALDLAAFIDQFELESLFLKLDVEGAEYPIFQRVFREGQLCQPGKVIYLAIETHGWLAPNGMQGVDNGFLNLFHCCGVVLRRFWR
jgi:hypothetical protein